MDQSEKIFVSYPAAQFNQYQNEIIAAIKRVCKSDHYILGPEVEAFEHQFAQYHRSEYCVSVGSGTDALILALRTLDIGQGDEVITVAHTALATVAAIIATGATPVLIDIEEDYFTLDPNKIELAITKKTKAIIPVHLYGQPCDMQPIMAIAEKYQLKVIEDCAQAHGATYNNRKVGTFGDIGCFSFYPTKNLGGIGDGGAIITNNNSIYKKISKLRQYGWDENRIAHYTSIVSRLDELQASILRIKLCHLDYLNQLRKKIADCYAQYITSSKIIKLKSRSTAQHVYHLYVIRTPQRGVLQQMLLNRNIVTGVHYKEAVHHHPAYTPFVRIPQPLNITEKIIKEILSLPIYPELALKKVKMISKWIVSILDQESKDVV